jgi:hypothetical protein
MDQLHFSAEIDRIEQLIRDSERYRALDRLVALLAVSMGMTISAENAEAFKRMRDAASS